MSIRIMALATVDSAGLVCLADAFAAGPEGPSFDCAKAQRPAEKAIYADARLWAIDRLVAEAYKTFEPAYGGNKKANAGGLFADRDACMDDITCIAAVLNNALETYRGPVPWVASYTLDLIGKRAQAVAGAAPQGAEQPMPRKIAECTLSHITSLTTRFGEQALANASPEAGSRVHYANGDAHGSYDREPGLVASRIGDPVAICLLSIPRDCPAGDHRGRAYYGVNLARQGNSWVLLNSQHMCGGA